MINQKTFLMVFLLISTWISYGESVPSLITGENINSTFSILAYDEKIEEWGIAVATDNIYVGNSTIYIEPRECHYPLTYKNFRNE